MSQPKYLPVAISPACSRSVDAFHAKNLQNRLDAFRCFRRVVHELAEAGSQWACHVGRMSGKRMGRDESCQKSIYQNELTGHYTRRVAYHNKVT